MKKIFIVIFEYLHVLLYFSPAIAAAIMFFAFKPVAVDHSAATADQREGIYIFICSKPAAAYEVQGSVKKSFALSGAPAEMLNSMLRKCKKEYPQANGIMFSSIDLDKADCIKFKE